MGLFNTILNKLGLGKKEEEKAAPVGTAAAKPAAAAPAKPAVAAPAKPAVSVAGKSAKSIAEEDAEDIKKDMRAVGVAAPAVKAISEVDVLKKLEQMAAGSGLNWKVSIVDLLKILDIDSSREARNELAKELGCPEELMHDSAKMNVWLHKEVLRQIAVNGGNIPKELLD